MQDKREYRNGTDVTIYCQILQFAKNKSCHVPKGYEKCQCTEMRCICVSGSVGGQGGRVRGVVVWVSQGATMSRGVVFQVGGSDETRSTLAQGELEM